jgi:hypothetical protein
MDDHWKISIPLTLKHKDELKERFSVPMNVDWKSLPKNVQKRHRELMEAHSALSQRQTRSPEWKRKNTLLLKKAMAGEDKAFLQLVARDPQYLCSELGLYFVSKWQAGLNGLYALATWTPSSGNSNDRLDLMDCQARKNLGLISSMLLKPFDLRGKRPGSPEDRTKASYYAALILFAGLKRLSRLHASAEKRCHWIDDFRANIENIPPSEVSVESKEGFLFHIQDVIRQVKKWPSEFSSLNIVNSTPGSLATLFVGKSLNVQERTLRKVLKSSAVISWETKTGFLGITKPERRLEAYAPVAKLLCTKYCTK